MTDAEPRKLRTASQEKLSRLAKELRPNQILVEVESKPDRNGDQTWTMFWRTHYIPWHPDGEWRDDKTHVRAQVYHANLEQWIKRFRENNRDFTIDNSRIMGR